MASLAGLPMELILRIIECNEEPLEQQRALAAIRGTCAGLHANTLHYFGSKYLTQIRVSLTEKDVLHLHAISQSAIEVHLQRLIIDVNALFEPVTFSFSSPSIHGGSSFQHHTYTTSTQIERSTRSCDCILDETVADFIEAASCKQTLGLALAGLSNLSFIQLRGPTNMLNKVSDEKVEEIERRWVVAAGMVLSTALSKSATLQRFVVDDEANHLYMRPCAFQVVASDSSTWTSSLQQLHLYLANDPNKASYPIHTRMAAAVFARLPHLTDLHLALPITCSPFSSQRTAPSPHFTQLADALPCLTLRRLHLSHLTTDGKSLAKFLDSVAPTLHSFTLLRSTLSSSNSFSDLITHLKQLPALDECVFRLLNVGFKGLYFGELNSLRPYEFDLPSYILPNAREWTCVAVDKNRVQDFVIKAEGWDSVGYWLEKMRWYVKRRKRWALE